MIQNNSGSKNSFGQTQSTDVALKEVTFQICKISTMNKQTQF